jgi:sRNA-binding carbon storage regulator CsrA
VHREEIYERIKREQQGGGPDGGPEDPEKTPEKSAQYATG